MLIRVASLLCASLCIFFNLTSLSQNAANENQRYLAFGLLNSSEDEFFGFDIARAAAQRGFNSVMITVRWDVVYPTPNSTPNWRQYDNQVQLCNQLGLKIFFRIHLGRCCGRWEGFWPENEAAQDYKGYNLKETPSLAYQPFIDKGMDFVKQVCERYRSQYHQGNVICFSATTTLTQEAGYHYEAYESGGVVLNGGTPHASMYDYSPSMLRGYRVWLRETYKNIEELNKAWRADFEQFSDIQPVNGDYPHPDNRRWTDWYLYRHSLLKNFLDKVGQTIKGVDPSFKVINEFGSVYDAMSRTRVTFAFKDLARNVDGTKINDARYYPHFFSNDLLRSNMAAGKWIMNEVFNEPGMSQGELRDIVDQHFERGCKLVNVVTGSMRDLDAFTLSGQSFVQKWQSNPLKPILPVDAMVVKLSNLVRTGSYHFPGYMSIWHEKKEKGPVEVRLVEDLLGEPEVNQPPVLRNPLSDYRLTAGIESDYKIPSDAFQDPDGKIEFYEVSGLPSGMFLDKNQIKGSTTRVGTYRVTVKATDMYEASVSTQFTLTIAPPQTAIIDIYRGGTFRSTNFLQTLKNNDTLDINQFNSPVNFIIADQSNIKAAVMRMTGAISQSRTETDIPLALFGDNGGTTLREGRYELQVELFSSTTLQSSTALGRTVINFVVANKRTNKAPVVRATIADQTAALNRAFSFTIPASTFQDPDGQIVRYAMTGLPNGLRASGLQISGTPSQTGSFIIFVDAFDNEGASVRTHFTLRISTGNQPPVVVSTIPNQAVIVNQPYEYSIPITTFRDNDGFIVRIIVLNIPPGLSFVNGRLTGQPTRVGEYTITVRGFDNEGATAELSFRLFVKDTSANLPPVVANSVPSQKAIINQSFSYTIPTNTFTDPEGSLIRLEMEGLPAGLRLQNGSIVGTPTVTGEFRATLRGYDNVGAFAETPVVILVGLANGNVPPVIVTPLADQNATVGQDFEMSISLNSFRDPDGIIVNLIVRDLPPGLTYQAGRITGKPTQAGTFTSNARAIDNRGGFVDAYFTIRVAAPPASLFSFSLFRAGGSSTRALIQSIKNNDRIAISSLPSFINIFTEVNATINRVEFILKGPIEVTFNDYTAPYGLFDDNGGFSPVAGAYTLQARAYRNNTLLVAESTISFQFMASGGGGSSSTSSEITLWSTYPNPFAHEVSVVLPYDYQPESTTFSLLMLTGQSFPIREVEWQGQKATLQLAPFQLHQGMYLLKIENTNLPTKTLKILKAEE
ncbi:MAG: putative Ig domain-containing protein [Runella sp.]